MLKNMKSVKNKDFIESLPDLDSTFTNHPKQVNHHLSHLFNSVISNLGRAAKACLTANNTKMLEAPKKEINRSKYKHAPTDNRYNCKADSESHKFSIFIHFFNLSNNCKSVRRVLTHWRRPGRVHPAGPTIPYTENTFRGACNTHPPGIWIL